MALWGISGRTGKAELDGMSPGVYENKVALVRNGENKDIHINVCTKALLRDS